MLFKAVAMSQMLPGATWFRNRWIGRPAALNRDEKDISQSPVSADQLEGVIARIGDGTISHNAARQVFDALWSGEAEGVGPSGAGTQPIPGGDAGPAASLVDALIEAKGLKQMSDTGALEAIVDAVIAANAKSVEEYRAGKDKAFNALVGQIMKAMMA